jgi:hypothetical protein
MEAYQIQQGITNFLNRMKFYLAESSKVRNSIELGRLYGLWILMS